MARINLLPWREWERERKQKEFLINVVGVLFFGAVLVFAGGWYLDDSTMRQPSLFAPGRTSAESNLAQIPLDWNRTAQGLRDPSPPTPADGPSQRPGCRSGRRGRGPPGRR